ncbi:MAG: hypothetical protein ABSC77_12785 [Terracidiphilus sp.]|jgi:hypothetical protein
MKSFVAVFVAAALVIPAFAQNMTLQEMQKKHSATAVKLAGKPVLLHTGKPITQADKQLIAASANKSITYKAPGVKTTGMKQPAAVIPPAKVTLTPTQMYQSGYVDTEALSPYFNAELKEYMFSPYTTSIVTSYLLFDINVQPGYTYVLTMKLHSDSQYPSYILNDASAYYPPGNTPPTFAGQQGDTEFAYAFVAQMAGLSYISIYSPNAYWTFESCEITATPVN